MNRPTFFAVRPTRLGFITFLSLLFLAGMPAARAQLAISMQLKRPLFMLHEPIIATVSVTNNSGQDVMLSDTQEGGPWFGFQITNGDGRSVTPRQAKYELAPLPIPAGQTVKRSVNLQELYTMDDYGDYRVRAEIYFAPVGKYFRSKVYSVQLTTGRVVWKQTVGVPESGDAAGDYRTFSLLIMDHEKSRELYALIQAQDGGTTYGCYDLGRTVADFQPDTKFDRGNNLWVLQLVGQKEYVLSRIGVQGDFQGQSTYVTPKAIPHLRKQPDGALQLVGAYRVDRSPQQVAEEAPKLSDRPAALTKNK